MSLAKWISDLNTDKVNDYFREIAKQRARHDKLIDHIHTLGRERREHLLDLFILKYESDEYIRRWYDRAIEPPRTIFSLAFDYAKKYGNVFTCDEDFCGGAFAFDKYIVKKFDGQGTLYKVETIKSKQEMKNIKSLNFIGYTEDNADLCLEIINAINNGIRQTPIYCRHKLSIDANWEAMNEVPTTIDFEKFDYIVGDLYEPYKSAEEFVSDFTEHGMFIKNPQGQMFLPIMIETDALDKHGVVLGATNPSFVTY